VETEWPLIAWIGAKVFVHWQGVLFIRYYMPNGERGKQSRSKRGTFAT
jgi:hypothetical protein